MSRSKSPHVSAALKHLRLGITASAAALAVCLLAQVVVWMVVSFGDVRTERLEAPVGDGPLVVVQSSGGERLVSDLPEASGVDVNTVQSTSDLVMARIAGVVQTVGVISAVVLAVLMFQGVTIAGGGNVPGVHMAVGGSTWALIVVLCCLPWSRMSDLMVFNGVFIGYEELVAESTARREGVPGAMEGWAYYLMRLVIPALLLGGLVAAVIRYRLGIEAGVIVTHASQLDEKLEREIRSRRLGELSTPRAVGALNQAIGVAEELEGLAGPSASARAPESGHRGGGSRPMSSRPSGGVDPPGSARPI